MKESVRKGAGKEEKEEREGEWKEENAIKEQQSKVL